MSAADFFAIYEHERETLGSSLVSREEYVLQPGERRELWLPMSRDATFVGVIGAFRDIRGARWRTVSQAPRKTATDMFSRDTVTLAASHGGITLAVKN
ncbi:MAG: type VI secretion system lipoprotein TssJ [Gammaproteobacteria bacterium]